jgi:hypothetical protein
MTIKEIISKKAEIIALKKNVMKYADPCLNFVKGDNSTTKADNQSNESDIIKIVGNTYNWLDSHLDVHVEGCFTKSIKENASKIFHLHDHKHEITAKVGDVQRLYETNLNWSDLGVSKVGTTTALVMETKLRKDYNNMVYESYKNGEIYNHSVGMIYVNLELAVNDSEEKEEYAVWNKYFDTLGNQEKALEHGYFWVVKEAKLKEISALLWDGSNELTPVLNNKIEPSNDTQKTEPSTDTQQNSFFIHLSKK